MQVRKVSNNTAFGAKGSIRDWRNCLPFNKEELKEIERLFEEKTMDKSGKLHLSVDSDRRNPYIDDRFLYTNGKHSDKLTVYMSASQDYKWFPKTVEGFVDLMVKTLDMFKNREAKIQKIDEIKSQLDKAIQDIYDSSVKEFNKIPIFGAEKSLDVSYYYKNVKINK